MPPELLTTAANWGFPAVMCLYLLWRADRLLTPLVTEAMTTIRETATAMKSVAASLASLIDRIDEGTERALGDHADIHGAVKEHRTTLDRIDANTLELLRRVPTAPAHKED